MEIFVSRFSDTVKRIVNKDIIEARQSENMIIFIDELCKEIRKLIGNAVEYLGYEPNDKISQIREINKSKQKNKKQFAGVILSTEDTYARAYNFKFKLTFKGEVRRVNMMIYVPMISEDGVNYLIKGNKYCTPFQLIDSVTYNRTDAKNKYDEVCLKTACQDIKMQRFKTNIRDTEGNSYNASRFNIKLNNKINKVPFLLFYFATFGFYTTLNYFGLGNPLVGVRLWSELPEMGDPLYNSYIFFKFGSLYLSVRRVVFNNESHVRDLIATILSTKKRSITTESIGKCDYWTMCLGSYLSQNNTLSSGGSLKITFHNSLDPRTSEIIKMFIGKDLKSIYAVVRWMFTDYSINVSKDMSMTNKRLRLSEYVIDPLKQLLKKKSYSYSRTRGGYRDIKRLEDVFKVSPSILLDAIIGKTGGGLNTGKYSNAVNDLAILHSITKATQTGPGAPGNGKAAYVPKDFKRLHQSMIGRTDLITTSVNSPGTSLNLLPNCKIDPVSLGFKSLIEKINEESRK